MTIVTGLDADDRRLLTVRSAADVLSISRGAIYNLLDAGELTSVHIGRARRIPLAELLGRSANRQQRLGHAFRSGRRSHPVVMLDLAHEC